MISNMSAIYNPSISLLVLKILMLLLAVMAVIELSEVENFTMVSFSLLKESQEWREVVEKY